MLYRVTKTYPHSLGLSASFRQWRATSHCNLIHGYSLAFTLKFEALTLDDRNWVIDFGSLGTVKSFLQENFDHKLIVAQDDPERGLFEILDNREVASVRWMPAVGCEAFAAFVARYVGMLIANKPQVRLVEVECREHEGNAASWVNPAKWAEVSK